jgi:CHAT domain
MGQVLLRRYKLTYETQDLDKAFLYITEAILRPSSQLGTNIFTALCRLADALLLRSKVFKQPDDLKDSMRYLRYLRDQPLEGCLIEGHDITLLLAHALAVQVTLDPEFGHAIHNQNIEEMTVLFREILTSDTLEEPEISVIKDLILVVRRYVRFPTQPSEQLIDCLREANIHLPDLADAAFVLSWCLFIRFYEGHSNEDYKEAMSNLDRIITSYSPSDCPGSLQDGALLMAADLSFFGYHLFGNPEFLEEAIFRHRTLLNLISPEHPQRPVKAQQLAELEKQRFEHFGVTVGLQDAPSRSSRVPDLPNHLPSFLELAASLSNSDHTLPMTYGDQSQHLKALVSMRRITDITDIEEAVCYCRLGLASTNLEHLLPMFFAAHLGDLLYRAFSLTDDTEYLNESIAVHRELLKTARPDLISSIVQTLMFSLNDRFKLFRDRNDLNETTQLCSMAVNNHYADTPTRFQTVCFWAASARRYEHSSTSMAYKRAMSLMRDFLALAPTLEIQHFRLVSHRLSLEMLPFGYASHQVNEGQIEQAIETLEWGRGLLWSEMRRLRASVDQLRAVDSHLAEKFATISRDLEELTMSNSSSVSMNYEEVDCNKGMDPFGRLVVEQRKLVEGRDRLISQIQVLLGFESFMKTPSFENLRSAAARGPVIIINHSSWRSDILVLLHHSSPSLLPTDDNFYFRTIELRNFLVYTRKEHLLESRPYQSALRFVLRDLYELIGKPVIQELRRLNIPKHSRIWWCPTSALCSLPLHAMGPVPSDDNVQRYFSDLYISSYTPTLSALIESRKPGGPVLESPAVLLVGVPDRSLLHAIEETWAVQRLDTKVTTLMSKKATRSGVLKGLQDHRFAHFACHGKLEAGKPFSASFGLHNGEQLTLLDIVRSQLPNAEFAFLSACHTAELTEESIADEGLHLTAAVQYCGFRSVVGTMWAMADPDGPDLVENFYKSMFSNYNDPKKRYRITRGLRGHFIRP